MSRPYEFVPDQKVDVYPPLNKETAQILKDMTSHPGWSIFLSCVKFEADLYKQAALNVGYSPHALEVFRFNQALGQNIDRIPLAVLESMNAVLDNENSFGNLLDQQYLE